MAEPNGLSPAAEAALKEVETADLVVGIPSFNNASTIRGVLEAAQAGLARHFASFRGAIIHSDGGSSDGTPDIVLASGANGHCVLQVPYPIYPIYKLSSPYHGMPGRGSAFRTIFQLAQRLGARACAVLDSDSRSVTPDWVQCLLSPVLEDGFDFVAPYYLRHKYDGTITNGIVYPLTRALYGHRVRQPIGGELAFSPRLTDYYMSKDVWDGEKGQSGIDIWLTTQAIVGEFRLCQAFLGTKTHSTKDPSPDLSAMLAEVVGALFSEMQHQAAFWQKVRGSRDVPLFGQAVSVSTEPIGVNVGRMMERFRLGLGTLHEIWSLILPPAVLVELKKSARASDSDFRLEDDLWVRIIFDFAMGFRQRLIRREQLFQALTPLYLAWVASFVQQVADADPEAVEARLEKLCLVFEAQKPYLISRWRWPDRFNP